eukprot:Pgem_evm1s5046
MLNLLYITLSAIVFTSAYTNVAASTPCKQNGSSCTNDRECCSQSCILEMGKSYGKCTKPASDFTSISARRRRSNSCTKNGSNQPCTIDHDCCSNNCVYIYNGSPDKYCASRVGRRSNSCTKNGSNQACTIDHDCCSNNCVYPYNGSPDKYCASKVGDNDRRRSNSCTKNGSNQACNIDHDCCSNNCVYPYNGSPDKYCASKVGNN